MKSALEKLCVMRNALLGLWAMSRPLVLISNILSWLLGVSIGFASGESIELISLGLGFSAMMLVSISVHFVNEYSFIIEREGVCPVCMTKVNEDQIKHIMNHLV